VVMQE